MNLDWSTAFHIEWTMPFLLAMLNIVFINIILSGDNAVLIAMAVRGLNKEQRQKGIIFGTAAAVILRIILTFFVAMLLNVPYLKLIGGALILWIATKLFLGEEEGEGGESTATLAQAIKIIIIADLTMSLDNVLGVAGAAGGNMFLLLFGLGLSIPIIIFTSNLISTLMDKYPIIIVIGAAILGRVGGEMMITDPAVEELLHPNAVMEYAVQIVCIVGVVAVGKFLQKRKIAQAEKSGEIHRS
ncbi:integral membrane protein, YjbE family [Syntrophus gentianae]|uniref:Integral membrane protein, YjbE family n=1 Tax=Syntrophus gentianae TaxID=43775 RepID=A0A1H7UVA3_9BACT|nr:TerC family protein [Syntrophus gentianae]SEM00920.1 integral membrane protein, YjbE family [Syntrophus gentianae]